PGLSNDNGFYGREQASFLLENLFNKVHPTGFEQESARKESAASQYHITGMWTIQNAGKAENRELYITLQQSKNGSWSVVSARSASK
ncbi:MAG TPA: DUF4783 domain-containing protein, partial [Thermoanaerobaculia bacterium]|nr:DUF4783 domain-containing protein [Thermoanaerobaculia bacterium]